MSRVVCVGVMGLLLVGCAAKNRGVSDDAGTGEGDPVTPECTEGVDFDGDLYGEGCAAGPDCDDYDISIHEDCPDPACDTGFFQGCPCDPATDTPVTCYEGPAETASTLPCTRGTRSCNPLTNVWTGCTGQVLPEVEYCDGADNDCDGDIDEGVLSACGNCFAECETDEVGDDPFPMPPDDPNVDADGVGLNPDGDLVLDETTYTNHYLWIANDPEGTVSKIDTRSGQEVARYATVSHEVLVDTTGGSAGTVPAWNAADANRPSRTAVDLHMNMWVANRAPSAQSTVTKIMNAIEECQERNGTPGIQTSQDLNGNGRIDIADPAEFFAEGDECIKMTVMVGTVEADGWGARAIAIAPGFEPGDPGSPWVGIHHEGAFYELDGLTGALKQRVPAAGSLGINPYGAAVASGGRMWAVDHAGSPWLVSINTSENPASYEAPVQVPTASGSYGMVVDQQGRVWIAGAGISEVSRYDPATGEGLTIDPFGSGMSRGLGIDAQGNVWAAAHDDAQTMGRIARINADTMAVEVLQDVLGSTPVGVGVDFDGDVWSVNQKSSNASRLHIDQVTLQPAPHPTTGNVVDVFPTGPAPYTYSDFTGLGLRTVTRPDGDYIVRKEGCPDTRQAIWHAVEWEATTPPDTRVEIWVRVGDDLATLSTQTTYGPWLMSPADLQAAPGPVPNGKYLELIIRLVSEDNETSPIVHSYSVQWSCPTEPVD